MEIGGRQKSQEKDGSMGMGVGLGEGNGEMEGERFWGSVLV